MGVEVTDIAKLLGGAKALHQDIAVFADLRKAIEKGFPAEAARKAMKAVIAPGSKIQRESFAAVVFETIGRRKLIDPGTVKTTKLSPRESERTERIARIFVLAEMALGDAKTARKFMNAPHQRLGGQTPLGNLRNEVGALEVEEILNSILYGLPA